MFFLWNAVLSGFISLVFFPVLVSVEIIAFFDWMPLYQAVAPFMLGFINRAIVLGTLTAEKRRLNYAPSAVGKLSPQPAMKPNQNDIDDDKAKE